LQGGRGEISKNSFKRETLIKRKPRRFQEKKKKQMNCGREEELINQGEIDTKSIGKAP
jgi:hypothetical protein